MNERFLELDQSRATGMEISDTAVRFVTLAQHGDSVLPEKYAELPLPDGCIDNGRVINRGQLTSFLKSIRKTHKIERVNLVLASSQIQNTSVSVAGAAQLYIKELVEKAFAMPDKDILYEYHAVGGDTGATSFEVTALPKAVAQEFLNCFKAAGIVVATIESIGHALSRALLPTDQNGTAMIVAIDADITTVAIVANGKVSQTTMFAFGDDDFIEAIAHAASVGSDEAGTIKEEQGLIVNGSRKVFDALADDCVALVQHVNDEYIAWRTAHKALPALETVYLTGAGSLLNGLDEYVAAGLRTPATQANVWANCLSFDEHIPLLSQSEAVRYASVIGAALADENVINLVPIKHKKSLQRKNAASVTFKIMLSFLLGVAVGFAAARILAMPTVHARATDLLHKIEARW